MMGALKVEVKGLGQLQRALTQVAVGMVEGGLAGQAAEAGMIAEDWRRDAPVDTGEYRDSVQSDEDSVFATARHAPFVWFGTSTHTAQPSDVAIERGRARMPATVGAAIRARLPR